ncbi:hypothetical protein SDRG_13440 [Saprolegnia diclina VS20]|uniref:EF-hand domain-containing protein n=1 Tax=Saprolegnia diclina (strain VS20) TaxID=1156394 RepID=T0Q2G4_SAPDV|nr:hypothetical protein SDRG_13440 [Saprolegnia diclina VS20]EQC28756.1 hypothetical protein SDRG_13440 [Saprolegnia diclina VS20]|eukprot:XP_008617751.1 hypothetical protein SDRG_13440 [Saprolegnia diclina VS20]
MNAAQQASFKGTIDQCVDTIWSAYDRDDSGYLDKIETRKFVNTLIAEYEKDGDVVPPVNFEECFTAFDVDGNGLLSRKEMRIFVEQLMGF